MADTPNLKLPYIAAAQAQKHVTHNEAIRALDAIVQIGVADRDLAAPPVSPAEGERYIVGAGATGAWAGKDGQVAAWQDGAWMFYAPLAGWLAWIADEDALVAWDGAAWVPASGGLNPTPLVGVNATADATNRLAVASPATLFNHEGAGHQHKINKNAATDTASVLFQTGFSGRAEFGTTGDDDWHVKVSPDGVTWHEALVADKDSGRVGFGTNDPQGPVHIAGDDQALVLENTQAPGTYWCIAPGRTAVYPDQLIISRGVDIQTPANYAMRFDAEGGAIFTNALKVSDGKPMGSESSIALAYYKPYTGTLGELSFRGQLNSGIGQFNIKGWYHDGSYHAVTVGMIEVTANGPRLGLATSSPSTTLHVNGPARVGSYTVAGVPSASTAGAGAIIYVSDETGGAVLAFSDGTDWRRVTDRAMIS